MIARPNSLTVISDDSIQLRAPVAIRHLFFFSFFFFFFLNLGEVRNSAGKKGHLITHLLI